MTISEIMAREIADEERKQNERQDAKPKCPGSALVKWGCVAGGFLAVATMLLLIWCCISDTPHRRGVSGGSEFQRTVRGCVPAK